MKMRLLPSVLANLWLLQPVAIITVIILGLGVVGNGVSVLLWLWQRGEGGARLLAALSLSDLLAAASLLVQQANVLHRYLTESK